MTGKVCCRGLRLMRDLNACHTVWYGRMNTRMLYHSAMHCRLYYGHDQRTQLRREGASAGLVRYDVQIAGKLCVSGVG